jgi:hypothetical protein
VIIGSLGAGQRSRLRPLAHAPEVRALARSTPPCAVPVEPAIVAQAG